MNLNAIIYTGADYKIVLNIPGGGSYPLLTSDSLSLNAKIENEAVFAIGQQNQIGNKSNNRSYSGKLSMQVGEIASILDSEGLPDSTFLQGVVIAVAAIVGPFQRTYTSVNVISEAIDIKAKDKQTLASMDFEAVGII